MATDAPAGQDTAVETASDPVSGPIYYQDTIRFKTLDGRYVQLAVVPAESGEICWLTLVDEPTEDCNFLVRNWDYDDTDNLHFSGNEDADTPDCHGNFRLIHRDTRPVGNVGDGYCVSMANYAPNVNLGYWGVSWDRAYDLETFTIFATIWPSSDGEVNSGDHVKIRNMVGARNPPPVGSIGQFLTVGDIDGVPRVIGSYHTYDQGHEFIIEKVAWR